MFKKVILFLIFLPTIAFASEIDPDKSSIVINADTREIIFADNHKTAMGIASTTKIMTAIIATENASGNDVFSVSVNAQNQEGSSIYLKAGEKITLKELLYGLMLNSGNDSAMVIAENIAKTSDAFAEMMNEKAKEIGCKNTHFENPSGLPSENHYSTAYDMALIMAYAMENDFIMDIISQKEYSIKKSDSITYLKNHNKLLWQYPYCIGGKTGYTKDAGRCLVSCSQKDNKKIVVVTLNEPNDWQTHINLSNKAFDKLSTTKIIDKNEILTTKKINGIPVNLLANNTITVCMLSKNKRHLKCRVFLDESINKDISIGEEIGTAEFYYKNYLVAATKLISGSNVKASPEHGLWNNFNYVFSKMLLNKK